MVDIPRLRALYNAEPVCRHEGGNDADCPDMRPEEAPAARGGSPVTDYPSDDDMRRLREWPYTDPASWLAFAHSIWCYADWGWQSYDGIDDFGRPMTVHHVSTGGWSGNESIIDAMQENLHLWSIAWYSHRHGGHYEFRVPREEGRP